MPVFPVQVRVCPFDGTDDAFSSVWKPHMPHTQSYYRIGNPNRLSGIQRVLVVTCAVLVIVLLLDQLQFYAAFKRFASDDLELTRLSSEIVYLDELLTMSARMAAVTGDTSWADRYQEHEPQLAIALEQAAAIAPDAEREFLRSVDGANSQLVVREQESLALVLSGDLESAKTLVFDKEYDTLKAEYRAGVDGLRTSFDDRVAASLESAKMWAIVGGVAAILAVGGTALILSISIVRSRQEAALLAGLAVVARRAPLGRLAASLAHELNQPLAAIVNYTGAAAVSAMDHEYAGPLRDAIEGASSQAQRAGEIGSRMREFSKPSQPVREEVDPDSAVRASVKLGEGKSYSRGITVEQVPMGVSLPILADPVQLQQVLVNLLLNAIAASAEGESVRVGATRRDGFCVFIVEDRGVGLDEISADRIFDAFYTTKDDGQGLGLAIARDIVEAHEGGSEVDARGPGATFTVRVPETAP